jgi:hypothetical protein
MKSAYIPTDKCEGLRFNTLLGCTSKTVGRHLLMWLIFCFGVGTSLLQFVCAVWILSVYCQYFGVRDLNRLACVASTGHPSGAVECLESLRVHVRGWRPAFVWGLSWLSPRRFCPYTQRSRFLLYAFMCVADMRRLTTGIRSEQCVVRRFRRCANIIECT